jgi:hypothetical protein
MMRVAGIGRVIRAALPRLAPSAARPAVSLTPLTKLTHGLPATSCSGWAAAALGVLRAKHTFVVDPQGTCVDEDDSKEEKPAPQRMPADAEPHLIVCAFGHDRTGTLSPVTAAIRKHNGSIMQAGDPPSDVLLAMPHSHLARATLSCVGRRLTQGKSIALSGHTCWIATIWTPTLEDHLVGPETEPRLPFFGSGCESARHQLRMHVHRRWSASCVSSTVPPSVSGRGRTRTLPWAALSTSRSWRTWYARGTCDRSQRRKSAIIT